MDETILSIPCELTSSATKSISKTTKLTFESSETVPPELIARITANVGKTGYVCFLVGERPIDTLDVLNLPELPIEKDRKSQASRIRSVLYRLWEQEGRNGDSETHYQIRTEQLIEMLKAKLKDV